MSPPVRICRHSLIELRGSRGRWYNIPPEGHMDFAKYFQRDPRVYGGETVITGTRVTLRTVLASLAEGSSFDEILKDYPSLSEDQLRAVVAFAAATTQKDLPLAGPALSGQELASSHR